MDSDEENDPRAHSTPKRYETENASTMDLSATQLGEDLSGSDPQAVGGGPGLGQTGDSTRSLLSVLSHSSLENVSASSSSPSATSSSLSTDSTSRKRRSKSTLSSSTSYSKSPTQSSQSRASARPASVTSQSSARYGSTSWASSQSEQRSRTVSERTAQSSSRTTPVRIRSSSSSAKTLTKSPSEPKLTPWEEWLVRKTEEERKRVRLQVRKEGEDARRKAEEERVKKEKETVIKARVDEWIEERTKTELEKRKQKTRHELQKKEDDDRKQHDILERAKANRQQWLTDKKKKEQEQRQKEEEDGARAVEAEQERKAKAEEAYTKWRQEAGKKPSATPSRQGYCTTAAYPIPTFYNPIPWTPIHAPKPTAGRGRGSRGGQGRGSKRGQWSAKRAQGVAIQPASPPLLFKDRQMPEKCNKWGRPR